MSCDCEMKRAMREQDRVGELAKKAAVLDQCMYAVFLRTDGTYGFGRYGTSDITGEIVELKHYL